MITNKNTLSLDKFYTNPDIVKICYDAIKKHLDINKNDLIIEPILLRNYLIIIDFMILNPKTKK